MSKNVCSGRPSPKAGIIIFLRECKGIFCRTYYLKSKGYTVTGTHENWRTKNGLLYLFLYRDSYNATLLPGYVFQYYSSSGYNSCHVMIVQFLFRCGWIKKSILPSQKVLNTAQGGVSNPILLVGVLGGFEKFQRNFYFVLRLVNPGGILKIRHRMRLVCLRWPPRVWFCRLDVMSRWLRWRGASLA